MTGTNCGNVLQQIIIIYQERASLNC